MGSKNAYECIKANVADGAAVDTNIAITGIVTTDMLIQVVNLTDLAEVADVTITSDGNIQSSSVDTSTKKLLVMWVDVSAG